MKKIILLFSLSSLLLGFYTHASTISDINKNMLSININQSDKKSTHIYYVGKDIQVNELMLEDINILS